MRRRPAGWLLLCALPALASEPDGEAAGPGEAPVATELEERVVVEAALPPAEDVAAFATTIVPDDVAGRALDLADLLRQVPGTRVRDYGGLGQYATVSVRASTPEQVTVFVDGIPQNRALAGGFDLSSVPATQIDRVTVFRGFGPAALGLGGLAGTVDIRTRAPAGDAEGSFDLLVGELDTRRLSTGWSIPTEGRGSVRIGAELLDSQGDFDYLDDNGTDFEPGDDFVARRLNNDLTSGALLVQGGWSPGDRDRMRAGLRVQRRERGLPGVGAGVLRARQDDALNELTLSWTRTTAGRLTGVDVLGDLFDQRTRFQDPAGEFRLGEADKTVDMRGGGVAGVMRFEAGRHRPQLRVAVRRERADSRDASIALSDRGGVSRSVAAATAEDVVVAGRVTIAPSLRVEHRADAFDPVAGVFRQADDVSETAWSGKLGVAWVVTPGASLRASAGRFHRNPTLTELFGDTGAILGNPALEPESGLSAELGASLHSVGDGLPWTVEAVLFARRIDDWILLRPTSQAHAVYRNLASAEIRGVETSAALRPARGLTLNGSLTRQQAVDTSGGTFDGEQVPFTPEWLAFGAIGWERRGFHAGWELTYVGENGTPADPALDLPARVIHDVVVSYRWAGGLTLGVDVRNLFDRRTRDVARFPLPGRVAFVHVGWQLGSGR